jgi:Antidote-toxin recognition MazE, bacterial antitoxin
MQVLKWGDHLAVRLPKELIDKMGLRAGDELNIVDVVERTLAGARSSSFILTYSPRIKCFVLPLQTLQKNFSISCMLVI